MERDNSMNLSRSGSLRSSSRTTLIRRNQSMSAKQIRFYRNGDRFFNGLKLAVSPERYKELDALLAELSTKLDLSSGAVRFIFNGEDGSMITDISQLHYGIPYVCSSTNTFKQLEVGYGKTAPQWALAQRNSRSTNTLTGLENLATPSKDPTSGGISRDFIKPKLVTVIRNGKPPQKKVTMLLNNKTAISLDQVLDHLSAKGSLGKVDKLYSVDRKLVKDLRDLFDDDTVFIAFASTEKFPEEGVELDPNSSRQWLGTSVIRHDYTAGLRPEIPDQRLLDRVENMKDYRPSSSKSVGRSISFRSGGTASDVESGFGSKEKGKSQSFRQPFFQREESSEASMKNRNGVTDKAFKKANLDLSLSKRERPRSTCKESKNVLGIKMTTPENHNKRPSSVPPAISTRKSTKQRDQSRNTSGVKVGKTRLARSPIKAAKQAFENYRGLGKDTANTSQRKRNSRCGKRPIPKRKMSSDRANENGCGSPGLHGYFVYVHEDSQGPIRARPTAFVKPSVPTKDQRRIQSEGKINEKDKSSTKFDNGQRRMKSAKSLDSAENKKSPPSAAVKTLQPNTEASKITPTASNNGASLQSRPTKLSFESKVEIQLTSNSRIDDTTKQYPALSTTHVESTQNNITPFEPSGGSSPLPAQFSGYGNDSGLGLHECDGETKSLAMEFASMGEPTFNESFQEETYTDEDEGYPVVSRKGQSKFTEAISTDSGITEPEAKLTSIDSASKSYVVVSVEPSPSPVEDAGRHSVFDIGAREDSNTGSECNGEVKISID